jgi:hypothetical protein
MLRLEDRIFVALQNDDRTGIQLDHDDVWNVAALVVALRKIRDNHQMGGAGVAVQLATEALARLTAKDGSYGTR